MSNNQAQYFPRKPLSIAQSDMGITDNQPLAPPQGKRTCHLPMVPSDRRFCRAAELFRSSSLTYTSNQHAALSTSTGCRPTPQPRRRILLTSSPISSGITTALLSSTRDQSFLVHCCSTTYSDPIRISAVITSSTCWQHWCTRTRGKSRLASATSPTVLSWSSPRFSAHRRESKRARKTTLEYFDDEQSAWRCSSSDTLHWSRHNRRRCGHF